MNSQVMDNFCKCFWILINKIAYYFLQAVECSHGNFFSYLYDFFGVSSSSVTVKVVYACKNIFLLFQWINVDLANEKTLIMAGVWLCRYSMKIWKLTGKHWDYKCRFGEAEYSSYLLEFWLIF